jgi:AAA domain
MHRGFLYQHLYSAACLLQAQQAGATAIIVERDDDLEIVFPDRHLYVQVKTRTTPLGQADIADNLANFDRLRRAHADGKRSSQASFRIVSNVAPGPALLSRMKATQWSNDVEVVWPGRSDAIRSDALPAPWPDTNDALRWCLGKASSLPFTMLSPEVLVWKLTGRVLLAISAGGDTDHTFHVDQLPKLFEQLVLQFQDFPATPSPYRPLTDEPPLVSTERVRVITGFAGAGKTAWASNAAVHSPGLAAYFDVADVPGPNLANSLSRELVGRFITATETGGLGQILLPGATGIDMLRLLEQELVRTNTTAIVVLDNAHRTAGEDLLNTLTATMHLRFVLLGQPSSELEAVRARLGLGREELGGWDNEAVAAEVAAANARADYPACQQLIEITGGLPLYVQSAIHLATREYEGDIAALCRDIKGQVHLTATAQEVILARFYDSLPEPDRALLTALSVAACQLTVDEALLVAREAVLVDAAGLAQAIRRLGACGVVRVFGNRRIKVHDAVRLLGSARLTSLEEDVAERVHQALKEALLTSLKRDKDVSRMGFLVQELGVVGDIETLTNLASDEMFHEMGLLPDFIATLDKAARDPSQTAHLRYWALDCIAFAQLHRGELEGLKERLDLMTGLVETGVLGARERMAVGMKVMLFAGQEGRIADVRRTMNELLAQLPDSLSDRRMVRYNAAVTLHSLGDYRVVEKIALELIGEYYDALGIDSDNLDVETPIEIWHRLPKKVESHEDLKRLADSLDLFAQSRNAQGTPAGAARRHAVKLYSMTEANRSTLKVGQDLVDELLIRGDKEGARELFESTLLPLLRMAQMIEWVVPIRGHYAVTLAHCGDFESAEREILALLPYETGLIGRAKTELQNQRRIIQELKIEAGQQRL